MAKEKKKADLMVVTSNDFNDLQLFSLTPQENKLLHTICAKIKNKDIEEIEIPYDEIKDMIKDKQNLSNIRLTESLRKMNKKLMTIGYTIQTGTAITDFILFPTFTTDYDKGILTVGLNRKYTHFLNNLTGNFTRYELLEFSTLSSKYALLLFPLLMQWKSIGIYRVSMDNFRQKMGISQNMTMSNIDSRILTPALREINEIFPKMNLTVEKIKKQGNRIAELEFRFTAIKSQSSFSPVLITDDNGVSTTKNEQSNTNSEKPFLSKLGVVSLNKAETKMVNNWEKVYGYNEDIVSACIDYVVTTYPQEKHTIRYCDAILKSWYAHKYKTVDEIPELQIQNKKQDDYIIGEIGGQFFFSEQ